MVTAHQKKLAVEKRCQTLKVFLPTQGQVTDVEDDISWLNKVIPVLNDRLLPAIWTVTISANVCVEEMGIGDDPGCIIKRIGNLIQGYILLGVDYPLSISGTTLRSTV
jgi:hypothetical protein